MIDKLKATEILEQARQLPSHEQAVSFLKGELADTKLVTWDTFDEVAVKYNDPDFDASEILLLDTLDPVENEQEEDGLFN
ncbi:hypothetical protein JCM19236_6297 [Vibrio sp. JCM 19236]|nr:hypothetical protein JCM19236_6297 [Vibrio sp. JCM 19236]